LGFTGIPPSTNLHLLFGIFCYAKTTCSYSSLLQVFARVEQQIKTPLRCTPLRPSFHSGEIFYFVKNSRGNFGFQLVPFGSGNSRLNRKMFSLRSPSFFGTHFSQIFSFRKNSRVFRNFSSSDFVEGKISPPRALRVV